MANIDITDSSFEMEVSNHKGFTLVDFWAPWCGPCKMLGPVLEEVGKEMVGSVKICKLNVDDNPEMTTKYGVRGIPTMVLFQDGKQVATKSGFMPKATLEAWLKSEME